MSNQHESTARPESVPHGEPTTADAGQEPATSPPRPAPTVADGVERRLDPRSITTRRIAGAITTAVLSFLMLIILTVVLVSTAGSAPQALLALLLWLSCTAGLAALSYGWPAVRYRYISYRLDANGLRIKSGVVWRSIVSVPQSRVQHTDVQQGPIERAFGLATLVLHTAGTQHASIGLSGLARETALRIRDHLIGNEEATADD